VLGSRDVRAAADILLTRSSDNGENFSEPRKVAASENYSDEPKLSVSPDGTLHLAYSEGTGGPFSRFMINYTRSTDEGASFAAPQTISRPLPDGIESARYSDVEVDADGNVYVLWELFPNARERPRGLAMAISQNVGDSFQPPMFVPESQDPLGGANGSQQG
jgi:hypothetical protein